MATSQSSPHHSRSQSISQSPATGRESPASRRSLFSSGYESSMQTTRHISSLLRNFDTIDEPDVMAYLEQIDRQQKQCISYHKLTLDKLNLLIDLLTCVPNWEYRQVKLCKFKKVFSCGWRPSFELVNNGYKRKKVGGGKVNNKGDTGRWSTR